LSFIRLELLLSFDFLNDNNINQQHKYRPMGARMKDEVVHGDGMVVDGLA
jgi:hypothetical protein